VIKKYDVLFFYSANFLVESFQASRKNIFTYSVGFGRNIKNILYGALFKHFSTAIFSEARSLVPAEGKKYDSKNRYEALRLRCNTVHTDSHTVL
jgi:hypothetical protein